MRQLKSVKLMNKLTGEVLEHSNILNVWESDNYILLTQRQGKNYSLIFRRTIYHLMGVS